MNVTGRELRSTVTGDGTLRLELVEVPLSPPVDDEVIVRVEAAPINPSDIGLMIGPADVATLRFGGSPEWPRLDFDVPAERLAGVHARIGQSLAVGNEGAGTDNATGASAKAH